MNDASFLCISGEKMVLISDNVSVFEGINVLVVDFKNRTAGTMLVNDLADISMKALIWEKENALIIRY